MTGQIEVFQGTDKDKLKEQVNAFNREHLVFATQHSTAALTDGITYRVFTTFVVFHNGPRKATA